MTTRNQKLDVREALLKVFAADKMIGKEGTLTPRRFMDLSLLEWFEIGVFAMGVLLLFLAVIGMLDWAGRKMGF